MQLLSEARRDPLEALVSRHIGRRWSAATVADMTELAGHPSAVLSDGAYSVFVKLSQAQNGLEQFEIELASLRLLSERGGLQTPAAIGAIAVESGALLVLEAVQPVERTPRHWRQIGEALASLHQVTWDRFGLETDGCFGPYFQDNRPLSDWPTFYAERRLWPYLRMAIDSGNLPAAVAAPVETLIARLPRLCGPAAAPSLLHGDAHHNNFISTAAGPVAIDPSPYYGNPEIDLATLDFFSPVPEDVFDGYRALLPIDPGFRERRDLWRIYGLLACVTDAGAEYLDRLTAAVQKYV